MSAISRAHGNRRAYNWLAYDVSDRFLQRFAPLFKGTLYDLGAGESSYRDYFLRFAREYVAVDWTGSLHAARPDIVADLNLPLPIDSEVADTVVSLSVLEHIREPQTMLDEAFRILKPGGAAILQVPWQWWIHEAPFDYFRYTPYGLTHLLCRAGFVDIRIEPQAGFFTTMTLKANYYSLRLIRGPKPARLLLRGAFHIGWYAGQRLAPVLDRFDRDWALEAGGYFATARKP
jgi:SAM-dependent methyltransferase